MKKLLSLIVLLLILIFGIQHFKFQETSLLEVPNLLANSRSKEFCSCFFILKKTREYCLSRVKKGYPFFDYSINEEEQSVTFKNPFARATSVVRSPERFGCTLF